MSEGAISQTSWAERAAERSPIVQRSKARGMEQAKAIVDAAQRLIAIKGNTFTTQELVREAGIALQTFYRYFEGKDQLILAVIEQMVTESAEKYKDQASALDDPLERLHFYVTVVIRGLSAQGNGVASARFMATEHWRLQALFPEDMARASHAYTELIQGEIDAAAAAGLLDPPDPAAGGWLITQLARSVFHYYAFVPPDQTYDEIAERVWEFCLAGLGGGRDRAPDKPRRLSRSSRK
jgi:TetR/AcrR family transcriptional regulator